MPYIPGPLKGVLPDYDGYSYEEIESIAKHLLQRTQYRPTIGVICGSGLGGLADLIEERNVFSYETIPLFPVSTVPGHSGCLVFGKLKGNVLVCMKGRFHPYEGYPMSKCAMPVRVMKLLGVKQLIVTNAAGGLNSMYNIGDIMIIRDHINIPALSGNSPLRGGNDERWGPRFPPMNNAYDGKLIQYAKQCFSSLKLTSIMREGCYIMGGGPAYETIAETKFLKSIGDAIGMSTAHEVTVAHHCGIRVLGFSLITNKSILDYDCKTVANHQEVLDAAKVRAKDFEKLVEKLIENLPNN